MYPNSALIPWLDPATLIEWFGPFAVLGVCAIVFVETGLLIGFLLPGDTLLILTGVLANPATIAAAKASGGLYIDWPIWLVCLLISVSAFLGDQLGYWIGRRSGPRVFGKPDGIFFSHKNVERTTAFFDRFGGRAVVIARIIPVLRTFAPVAAGVGRMHYRRFALYNAVGAIAWGAGVTLVGWAAGFVPFIRDLVVNYIEYVLLGIVALVAIPIVIEAVRGIIAQRRRKAAIARGEEVEQIAPVRIWTAEEGA